MLERYPDIVNCMATMINYHLSPHQNNLFSVKINRPHYIFLDVLIIKCFKFDLFKGYYHIDICFLQYIRPIYAFH